MKNHTETEGPIERLNNLLQSELAAVEAYGSSVGALDNGEDRQNTLRACLSAHRQRAMRLRELVLELGGRPAYDPGACLAFAKTVEDGADLLGAEGVRATLEEGEDRRFQMYYESLETLNSTSLRVVVRELLHEQRHDHGDICAMKLPEEAS